VSVVELVKRHDGLIEEHKAPKQLPSNKATVLDVYGHLFYAGARTLERLLPKPEGAENPAVILRLRGRSTVGATLIEVLSNYADKLKAVDGRLYLTGISEVAYDQLVRTGKLRLTGPVRAYEATPIRGQSTQEAVADARTWLVGKTEGLTEQQEEKTVNEKR
jgi:SulP family sulfate permease